LRNGPGLIGGRKALFKKNKANLNHEGHEDHEGFLKKGLNLVLYQIFFVYFVTFVVN
jgi:hypothetical protein